jgi:hypothetical protein
MLFDMENEKGQTFDCKECQSSFDSLKSLHSHIKKHDMLLGDYYVKNFQRKNKLTGELLPFKNYEEYFEKDFSQPHQLMDWCKISPFVTVKNYIGDILDKRIKAKNLKSGLSSIELWTLGLPDIDVYKKYFGSYTDACKYCLTEPMFNSKLPKEFWDDYSDAKILVDTREQKPLIFKKSSILKLDIGDYAVSGNNYNYTHVDRKSFEDFCSTVTVSYNRFAKELDRCRSLGCYLFIVTEAPLYSIEDYNKKSFKKFNLKYVFHNMRELQREYSDCCQFVFSGSRTASVELIPKLLVLGRSLWKTDIQYFWSKKT